ncbi:hypothetical protein, partial [Xanthovirga aplysinae]|uniref:hypothetical protein n=1 Tax=Xanthovirga aplysinae TaxID=2529853 RepID=UPI001CA4438F
MGLIDFKEGNSGKATIENSTVYQLIVSESNTGSNFDSCTGSEFDPGSKIDHETGSEIDPHTGSKFDHI